MAKKVTLNKTMALGTIVPGDQPVEQGGVRITADSSRRPDVGSKIAGDHDSIFPIVDAHTLNPQDANDGTEDGDQPTFEMPAFANSRDMRVGR